MIKTVFRSNKGAVLFGYKCNLMWDDTYPFTDMNERIRGGCNMAVMFSLGLLIIPLLFLLHIAICIWGYNDARRMGRSPEFALLVVLGMLFFPVVGPIIYLLIRNS